MMKMANKSEDSVSKEKLLEQLEVEADKSEDEIDVELINKLTELLDTKEARGNSVDDYEEFLQRFNERNGTSLKNRKKTQKASILKRYSINYAESFRIAACVAASVFIMFIHMALGIAGVDPDNSFGAKAYERIMKVVNEYIDFDKLLFTTRHEDEGKFETIDNYYVSFDVENLNDFNIMKPTFIPDQYELDRVIGFTRSDSLESIEIAYKDSDNSYFIYDVSMYDYNDRENAISLSSSEYLYIKTIEVQGICVFIYNGIDNQALFFADNNFYTVNSDMNIDAFCDVLKSFSFNELN